jgi:hypothetical protein
VRIRIMLHIFSEIPSLAFGRASVTMPWDIPGDIVIDGYLNCTVAQASAAGGAGGIQLLLKRDTNLLVEFGQFFQPIATSDICIPLNGLRYSISPGNSPDYVLKAAIGGTGGTGTITGGRIVIRFEPDAFNVAT